jgi:AraC-like DNA-binding protein
VDSVDTAAHSFSSQARAALELCGFAEQRKKSHNGQMAGRVAAYIEANYADPQMCLAAVAREFRLSEAYVSGFFKEQHGENFSDYLERLRLSHANRLLSESFMPIREIAVRVGYGSDKAFRRAFKRVHGISPHAYREIPRRMAQSGASR